LLALDKKLTIRDDEILYRRPVVLYFGGPWTDRQQNLLDQRAIDWNCSFEDASLHYFKNLVQGYCENKNEAGRNYFDLSIFIHSGIHESYSPKVSVDSYILNGFKFPRLVLENGFIRGKNMIKRFYLKDEVIDLMGQDLENHCEYEYIEFKRLKNV